MMKMSQPFMVGGCYRGRALPAHAGSLEAGGWRRGCADRVDRTILYSAASARMSTRTGVGWCKSRAGMRRWSVPLR